MSASMHSGLGEPRGLVKHGDGAGEREPSILFDRQRVHVRAKHDDFAWSIFEDTGEAVPADRGMDIKDVEL